MDSAVDLDYNDFNEKLSEIGDSPFLQATIKATGKQATIVRKSETKVRRPQVRHEHHQDKHTLNNQEKPKDKPHQDFDR